MTIVVRETKRVTVEWTSADLDVGALRAFLRECNEAKLPADATVGLMGSKGRYTFSAEHVTGTDNPPGAAGESD